MSDETTAGPQIRETSLGMRAVFWVGSVLVTAAGVQLFVLTDHTDRLFAWTIKNPLTAAFLGAFYLTALVLAFLSGRERVWVRGRVGVPGVFVFITLTFVATLLHVGQFHFHDADSVPKGAAYLWFTIYLLDPLLVLVVWPLQLRRPGVDPPREHPLPGWYRAGLAANAAIVLGIGIALFAAPERTARIWPWTLTPLTARAVGAWLIGLGLVLAAAVHENALERIRNATAAYAALGALQFVALIRYPHAPGLDWGSPATWLYVAVVAKVGLMGAYGWVAARPSLRRPAVRI